ncbi:MAG: hypothetical protein LAO24_13810 [Acidobacteriia bacterium]|nr:hypothetical protein [Terriglobia bacterium]
MAAQCLYCPQCHKKYSTHLRLFDTLYDFSKAAPENCPACGSARELHITLDFQLGVGDGDFKVVHAFLPDKLESWLGEDEEEVTLYPFLVVLQGAGESKQFCWMPYWHVVGKEARFGQHALCLEHSQFESLAAQAQQKMLVPA